MGTSTWDDTPAPAADSSWKADGGDAGGDEWQADNFNPTGDFSENNISKHDGPADGGCRICGDEAHFARDCNNKPEGYDAEHGNSGECYNCGQTGHNKADCTNERVEREFTGECRTCGQVGHRAAQCPQAVCKLCKAEGHDAASCEVNRLFAGTNIQDKDVEEAWKDVERADKEKDVEDIKKAILVYAKAFPTLTLEELETTFREAEMNTYLIAKEQEISDVHTIVNLQGKTDQKFVLSFQFSAKPRRAKFAEGWPSDPAENLVRLAEAGFVMDGLVRKCRNCDEIGHNAKDCEQEKNENAKVAITCAVCNEEGHRARDCTQERKSNKKGCRNCGSEEHIAKECDQPRNADNVECKNCSQMGHFSKDCPDREPEVCRNCYQEGHRKNDCTNERVMKCRNCDELGHMSKECSKPTDWSRVKCNNCEEFGHTYKRCTQPPKPKEDDMFDNPAAADGGAGEGSGGWDSAPAAESGGWDAPAESSGGW